MLLANAVWRPDPERFADVVAWCEARGIPDAIVIDGDDARRRAAAGAAGYRRGGAFEAVVLAPDEREARGGGAAPDPLVVEQAAYGQAHAAGLLLARRYRQPRNAVPLGGAIADALRRAPDLALWLAYREGEPVGALLGHRGAGAGRGSAGGRAWSGLLQAGDAPARRALDTRLATEARAEGGRALRWSARGGHGGLAARGLLRLERPDRGERPGTEREDR